MKKRIFFTVLALLLLLPLMAQAEWERTVSAWDTRLPDEGKLQVSAWGYHWRSDYGTNRDLKENVGLINITYGFTDNWSISAIPTVYHWNIVPGPSRYGFSDTMYMTTYRFLSEGVDDFDLAIQGSVSVPTGSYRKGLGSNKYEPGAALLGSKTFGSFTAVANIGGYSIISSRAGEKSFIGSATLEGVFPVNDEVSFNVALSATSKRYDTSKTLADGGVGFRYTPIEMSNMFVAGMAFVGFTDARDWGLNLAFGFEF